MELLLDFMYGASKPGLTFAEAVDLFVVSDMYAFLELHLQCTRILKSMISPKTVCALLHLALAHHCTDLKEVGLLSQSLSSLDGDLVLS